MSADTRNKIVIGISSCLLGHKVRFDGNHKEQRLITHKLSKIFEFVPTCPEMAIGLGAPRTPIHLTGDENTQRLVNIRDESIDVTHQLVEFGRKRATELSHISGYIFKKGSPSCGLFNVKIYKSETQVLNSGMGLFAREMIKANPLLPVEEEGRLNDDNLRTNFLQRVEIYHRWQQLIATGISKKSLLDFHTQHKYTLLAHCASSYRSLGRLLANTGKTDLNTLSNQYISILMEGLKQPSSRGKHINVLEHIAGYFKHHLDSSDKSEFRKLIEEYRSGDMPREALLTILKHYLRKFPNQYLHTQHYLNQVNKTS
jgi:uncharacterized protein YbgA (DUF1722 family)/uncharacterized protein YbbK (DUF523 family)